jgi:hypothetical protein
MMDILDEKGSGTTSMVSERDWEVLGGGMYEFGVGVSI